jgi:hypothetical protein
VELYLHSTYTSSWHVAKLTIKVKVMLRLTVSLPVIWCQAPFWSPRPDFCNCQTVAGLLTWGALSDERTGRLQLLLGLASAVILGPSTAELDHILLSHIRDSLNLEGQVSVFISPRNSVDQLYIQTLGFSYRRLLRLAELRCRYSNLPPHWRIFFKYIYSVRTSQETYYVSATKPNRLMLFRETVAVYCENHTKQIHTNSVRTSQETHYISATKPNRLMLFRETVAVYCENHTEHKYTLWAECRVPLC